MRTSQAETYCESSKCGLPTVAQSFLVDPRLRNGLRFSHVRGFVTPQFLTCLVVMPDKRFRIALSFAGEKRHFVEKVAKLLAERFGENKILYDKYHEAEFSRSDLAFYLPELYHSSSDLIVAVFCPAYEEKEWCGLEWKAIFDLLKKRRVDEVMLTRFGYCEGPGLYSLAGYLDLQNKTPEQTVDAILERLAINEGHQKDFYTKQLDGAIEEGRPVSQPSAFFNVPYNSKGDEFVGRVGKIDEIWNELNRTGCAAIGQAISLHGLGGWGKTQLAVEYAHHKRGDYQNGVYWLVADQTIENQLVQIAEAKGWIIRSDKSVNQIDIAIEKFKQLTDSLVIFDNVESQSDIRAFLPKAKANAHILITSRERQSQYKQIEIGLLSRNESRELLHRLVKREPLDATEIESRELILEILGGIPLAVELVGGYLAEHETIGFSTYLKFLNEQPLEKLESEFPDRSFTNHDRSIIRTLRISEKTIEKKPLMVEILKVLSWSGSSSMGISLLTALVGPENDFDFANAIADAHKLRLLTKNERCERYTIHRLVARVIRHEMPIDDQKKWKQKIATRLEAWFDEKKDKFDSLVKVETECEHLREWRALTYSDFPLISIRLNNLNADQFSQRGNYQKALDLLQESVNEYELSKVDDRSLFASLQNYLGVVSGMLGDDKAALQFKLNALEINRELFGEQHASTATSYNNVGCTYNDLGDHLKALEFKKKAFLTRKELFGEKHLEVANSYNNVGSSYGDLGDHAKALEYKLKALKIRIELCGYMHPDTAISLNNVGFTYGELGNFEKAREYLQKALEIQRELFGDEHPATASFYSNVGHIYADQGDYLRALEYEEIALRLRQELFGNVHPDTAISYNNIGRIYHDLGDQKRALDYTEKTLEILEDQYGENHPKTATAYNNVGSIRCALGRYREGIENQEKALTLRRKLFGEKHPETASSYTSLGRSYEISGDRQNALEHKKKAFELNQYLLGDHHPKTITSVTDLIHSFRKQGLNEKAGRLAARYYSQIPTDHEAWDLIQNLSRPYRKAKKRRRI